MLAPARIPIDGIDSYQADLEIVIVLTYVSLYSKFIRVHWHARTPIACTQTKAEKKTASVVLGPI